MKSRRQPTYRVILKRLRIDFLLVLILVAVASVLAWVNTRDIQPAREERSVGSRPPDRSEGDVLLLLPDNPAAQALSFDELDCSYGWFNTLWQEFGSFATTLMSRLNPDLLRERSVVIVPRRVAQTLPETGLRALRGFVESGGQLIVERPPPSWTSLLGFEIGTSLGRAQRISSAEGLAVHGPMRRHLPDAPLVTEMQVIPPMDPYPEGPVMLEVDGYPGWLTTPLGRGYVHTFTFDLSCTITAIQQGYPTRGMQFGPQDSPETMLVQERIAHPRMQKNKVPYADLLERVLFHRLSQIRPLARLWPFPGQQRGVLLISHPSPDNTRAALGFADFARRLKGRSTLFVAADRISPVEATIARNLFAETGLLWIKGRTRPPLTETYGLATLQPFAAELSLAAQMSLLRENTRQAGRERRSLVRVSAVEETAWHNDFSTTFRHLAFAHVQLDHSFGPANEEAWGYLFGTTFPFYPLDHRGLPLPVLELPFLINGAHLSADQLEQFLGNSRSYFHQIVSAHISTEAMRVHPSADLLLGFQRAFELGRDYQHWVAHLGDLLSFLAARRQSVLTSDWRKPDRHLRIVVDLRAASLAGQQTEAVPGVAFPRTFEGREVERVLIDDQLISLRKLETSGPSYERILEVPPGQHVIDVFYDAAPTK